MYKNKNVIGKYKTIGTIVDNNFSLIVRFDNKTNTAPSKNNGIPKIKR